MFSKLFKSTIAAAVAMNFAAAPTRASDVGAAIAGAIIGGAIVSSANKSKKRRRSSSGYSVQRQQNREMQSALNYFNFPAGSPDGVIGGKTRRAVARYQTYMGLPATGTLSQYDRDFLVASYNRAQIGGPEVIKAMQGTTGVRGLLLVWRDEAAGVRTATASGGSAYAGVPREVGEAIDQVAASADPTAEQLLQRAGFLLLADLNNDGQNDYIIDTSVTGSAFWCGSTSCSVMVFVSTPQGYVRNDFLARGVTAASFSCHQSVCRLIETPQTQQAVATQSGTATTQVATAPSTQTAPQPEATATATTGLPSFNLVGEEQPEASLASRCSKVSLLTNSNGGYVTLANMTDPDLALGEQFCLTRSYAIGMGETMVSKVQGLAPEQVDAQCDGFGPVLEPFIAGLADKDSGAVRGEIQKFALESNMSLDQLDSTARICLYSGYRRDQMNVALGAALVLAAIGKTPYAELVGHHLSQGFGVRRSPERAQEWYDMAISGLEAGVEPVFAPGQPERVDLLKAAARGLVAPSRTAEPSVTPASSLPTFKLD